MRLNPKDGVIGSTYSVDMKKVACNFSSAALYSSLDQVGGIKPGCFKIGNTGGMMDNIITSKLYRPGRSV